MSVERVSGYIRGYADGRIDAHNAVKKAHEKDDHTDQDVENAALGVTGDDEWPNL